MANDPSLPLREAVVTKLKTVSALIAITTAAKVYGEQPSDTLPERPFCRYGDDLVTPLPSSCGNGAEVEFPIHSFSTKKYTDQVRQMNAIIADALGGAEPDHSLALTLEGGETATLVWLGSTVTRDAGDPTAWHGIARFRATI